MGAHSFGLPLYMNKYTLPGTHFGRLSIEVEKFTASKAESNKKIGANLLRTISPKKKGILAR